MKETAGFDADIQALVDQAGEHIRSLPNVYARATAANGVQNVVLALAQKLSEARAALHQVKANRACSSQTCGQIADRALACTPAPAPAASLTATRINELANEAMRSIDVEDDESYAFARCAIEYIIAKAVTEATQTPATGAPDPVQAAYVECARIARDAVAFYNVAAANKVAREIEAAAKRAKVRP